MVFSAQLMIKQITYNILIWLGITGCIGGLFVTIGLIMVQEYISLVFSLPTILISYMVFRWAENKDRGKLND